MKIQYNNILNIKKIGFQLLVVLCLFWATPIKAQKKVEDQYGLFFTKSYKKTVRIQFKLISNLIVVPIKINESDTLHFILDTGVSTILLTDPVTAKKLNVFTSRKVKISGVGNGEVQTASVSSGNTIKMGEMIGYNQNIVVLDNDFLGISEVLGVKIDGIFGYDVFNFFVVSIDFTTSTITLEKPETFKYKSFKGDKFPLEIIDTKPFLKDVFLVSQQGVKTPLNMLIDTGAGHAISLEITSNSNIKLPDKIVPAQLGKGLSGVISGNLGRINKVIFGRFELAGVVASFPDSLSFKNKPNNSTKRNGNIGCEILRRFIVTFNYSENYILLKPIYSKIKEEFEHNMSGIEFVAKGNNLTDYFIETVEKDSPGDLSGFKVGDQIIAINNTKTADDTLSNIYKTLQKKEGRIISMLVIRDGKFYLNSFKLRRLI